MISSVNPVSEHLMPRDIDRRPLAPQHYAMRNGKCLNYFVDNGVGLVKMDFVFEAGTVLQTKALQAAAAINLITEGTSKHTSRDIAEFFDYRGIIVEKSNDEVSSTLTVYALPRYAAELLPLLHELFCDAVYPDSEFGVFVAKRRQQLSANFQRPSYVARIRWCECVYGSGHLQARYATPADLDDLTVDDVRDFYRRWLTPSRMDIVIGGAVTAPLLSLFDEVFGADDAAPVVRSILPEPRPEPAGRYDVKLDGAVQNTLRVGRLLPMRWNDCQYAEFMVLSTVLGGYFGSRLMSNIREDKGYTYGISAMTQINRGNISFFITSDVSADKAEAALGEIRHELERLCEVPIGGDELELVRMCMLGDFMRSVDGVFERSERFCQMFTSGVDERFTDNYFAVLEPGGVTAEHLRSLASELLNPSTMTVVNCGICR